MRNLLENEKNEKLYLQINTIKLEDYISRGIILPDKYLNDNAERDTQTDNKSYLALSHGYINSLDKNQLLLELIFTEEERKELKQSFLSSSVKISSSKS